MEYHTSPIYGNAASTTSTSSPAAPSAASPAAPPPAAPLPEGMTYGEVLRWLRSEYIVAGSRADMRLRWRVTRHALSDLGVAYHPRRAEATRPFARLPEAEAAGGDHLCFPLMGSADDEPVGVWLRRMDSPGLLVSGSPGVLRPVSWDVYPGVVMVVRDPVEAAALLTVGVCAVGLPDPTAGLAALVSVLRVAGVGRGTIAVGDRAWAAPVAQALRQAGIEWAWWSPPPAGCASCHEWVYARVAGVTDAGGLIDLGDQLDGLLEGGALDPDADATPSGSPPPPPPATDDPPEAAADVLMSRPYYWAYLSAAARHRYEGPDDREVEAAQKAWDEANPCDGTKSEKERAAAVEKWIAEGVVVSRVVDAEEALLATVKREEAERDAKRQAAAQRPQAATVTAAGQDAKAPPEIQALADTLALVELDVMGQHDDHSVVVYSRARRQIELVPSVGQLSYQLLLQIAGDPAVFHVVEGQNAVAGKRTIGAVRSAVAYFSSKVRLDCTPPLGQGCWRAGDGVVIVNGCEAAVARADGSLTRVAAPRLGGHVLGFEGKKPWVDFDVLGRYLGLAADHSWCQGVLQRAHDLFARWEWRHKVDASVTAALAVASWVQTIWPWRPEVAVAGPSDCGKSSLFKTLAKLFGGRGEPPEGGLGFYSVKPSEAGIRQHVGGRACVIMLDEFESDSRRQAILEMFRTSSQGGPVHRGSSDQRGRQFVLRHIPWTGAIESGLTKTADRNRFIVLDLAPLGERRGRLTLPDDDDLCDLGVRMLALALRHMDRAVELFRHLKMQKVPDVDGRVVENYSVPAALAAAALGHTDAAAINVMTGYMDGRTTTMGEIVADERALLAALAESKVDTVLGERAIAEILANQHTYGDVHHVMERSGVAAVTAEAKKGRRPTYLAELPMVFVVPDLLKRYHLARTDWAAKNLDQLLLRIPGARRDERRLAGMVRTGISIPRAEFKLLPDDEEVLPENSPPIDDPPAQESAPSPPPLFRPTPTQPQPAPTLCEPYYPREQRPAR